MSVSKEGGGERDEPKQRGMGREFIYIYIYISAILHKVSKVLVSPWKLICQ